MLEHRAIRIGDILFLKSLDSVQLTPQDPVEGHLVLPIFRGITSIWVKAGKQLEKVGWSRLFRREMLLSDYFPILVQILLAGALAGVILVASVIFGQRGEKSSIKDTAYECGIVPTGAAKTRFSIKFYVIAMLFILLDIEIVFLIPWVLIYRDFLQASIPIVLPVFFFIFLLVVGLFYEMKKGALEWER